MRAFPRMSVLDNVVVGAYVGANSDDGGAAAGRWKRSTGSASPTGRPIAIAGGLTTKQLRLMELARALAPRPKLLLLDETLAGLGHDELDDILTILRRINARRHDDRHHRAHDAGDDAAGRRIHRARPWR